MTEVQFHFNVPDRLLYASRFGTRGPATVGELLDAMVDAVGDALPTGDPAAVAYFTNWHPDRIGGTPWADALNRPTDGLAVSRTDTPGAVLFTLR